MKSAFFLFVSLVSISSAFAENSSKNIKLKIDWSDQKTLTDNVVQQCDDSFAPAVEITVPGKIIDGKPRPFAVEMGGVSITTGKVILGCELVEVKQNKTSTTYILDATAGGGGCTVRVRNFNPAPGEGSSASFDISDAC